MIWRGKKIGRLFSGKQKRILGMLFAMVTQLLLINLSPMKRVPDSDTPQHPRGSRYLRLPPGGFSATKSHHVPGWASKRATSSLPGPPGLPGPATPRAAPQGDGEPACGRRCAGFRGCLYLQKEGSFFPHFQDKVSFMRASCWTNQVNWEALNSSHWADPSFLLKADSADGEITSALNSFSPSLNFTPISGWRGSEQMCDTGVVQFSFAGSKLLFLLFGFWCGGFFLVFFFFPFNHHHCDYFSVRPVLPISPDARDTLLIYTSWSGVNYSTVLERCRGHLERCGRLM